MKIKLHYHRSLRCYLSPAVSQIIIVGYERLWGYFFSVYIADFHKLSHQTITHIVYTDRKRRNSVAVFTFLLSNCYNKNFTSHMISHVFISDFVSLSGQFWYRFQMNFEKFQLWFIVFSQWFHTISKLFLCLISWSDFRIEEHHLDL